MDEPIGDPYDAPSSSEDESAAKRESVAGMRGPDGPLLRLIRDRRVAFLCVGVINTVVGFAWFALFDLTVGRLWGYMVTLMFAHVASVLCAFVLYRRAVFRVRGHVWRDLLRFEMVYLTALGVNAVLLPLLVEFAGLEPIIAQALIVFITTLISYFGHSRFSFRRKQDTP
ncbi:GtrA family protein [Microbacterium sp. YJN-G]|uniref:GtrA family protein n=1 Tax=Microbacterium sp. YJN-G TaxID=2763257 RepID=UPI001D0C9E34|nr:GtrA family protein [Microbacterium sp. YJN-G]